MLSWIFYGCLYGQVNSSEIELHLIQPQANQFQQLTSIEWGVNPPREVKIAIENFIFNNKPPGQGLNPFLSWEVNLEALFIHEETGEVIKRHGFYYRAMDRDEPHNTWKDVDNDYPFRIRFTPPHAGTWKVKTRMTIKNQVHYDGKVITIDVRESIKSGYVELHPTKKYFQRDEQIFLASGINLPFPYVANNVLYSHYPDEKLHLEPWMLYRNDVRRYIDYGGKFFRFFMYPSSVDLEFEKLGNYYDRLNFAWELDHIIAMCEENNVLIDFNLFYHTPIMRSADYHQFRYDYSDFWHDPKAWPYRDRNHVYAYSKAFNSSMPSDMFMNEESMRFIKERMRYIIARWGHSTAIAFFELLSEPWHLNEHNFEKHVPYFEVSELGDLTRKAAHKYHKDIASYIKDTLEHRTHLLGAVGPLRLPQGGEGIRTDSTWYEKNIDFLSISAYSKFPHKMLISKRGKQHTRCEEGENSYACHIRDLQLVFDKPVFFGEADHSGGTHGCSDLQGHQIDAMRFGLTGAAGHCLWGVFSYPHRSSMIDFDERKSWPGAISAHEFYNHQLSREIYSDFGFQGREKKRVRRSKRDLKEHQYIVNSSRSAAIGYVYNRTFNIHTAAGQAQDIDSTSSCFLPDPELRQPVSLTWKPNRMHLDKLRPLTNYEIRYFGYPNGQFLTAIQVKSSVFGKLKLVHPKLGFTKDTHPLIWYQVVLKG